MQQSSLASYEVSLVTSFSSPPFAVWAAGRMDSPAQRFVLKVTQIFENFSRLKLEIPFPIKSF